MIAIVEEGRGLTILLLYSEMTTVKVNRVVSLICINLAEVN